MSIKQISTCYYIHYSSYEQLFGHQPLILSLSKLTTAKNIDGSFSDGYETLALETPSIILNPNIDKEGFSLLTLSVYY